MLNFKTFTSVAFAVASATSFLFGANVVDLVKDDFEKGENSPAFSNQFFTKKSVKLVSGKEAIKGNYALFIDGKDKRKNGNKKINFFTLKCRQNVMYLLQFTYHMEVSLPE